MDDETLAYAIKVNDRDLRDLVKRIDSVNHALGPETVAAVEKSNAALKVQAQQAIERTATQRRQLKGLMEEYLSVAATAKKGSATEIAAHMEAAKAARKLGIDVHEAGVQYDHLGRQVNQVERDVGRASRGLLAGTGILRGFGRAAAYGSSFFLGFAAVGEAGKLAYDTLRANEKEAALAAAALKSTGNVAATTAKQIDAYAESESKKVPIDKASIEAAEVMLLRFTQVRNELGKGNDIYNQARDAALDLSVKTGDASSAALILGKALNDPIRGLTALRRAGVGFTQAQADQIKALTQSGHILEAQKLILKQVEISYGDAANAAGKELGGQLTILKHTGQELGASMLRDLMPQIQQTAGELQKWLDKEQKSGDLNRAVKQDVKELADVVRELWPVVKTAAHWTKEAADAVGGWKQAFELLLALKILKWAAGVKTAIAELIGAEAAAGAGGGLLGAAGAAGLLRSRLIALTKLSPIVLDVYFMKHYGVGNALKAGTDLFATLGPDIAKDVRDPRNPYPKGSPMADQWARAHKTGSRAAVLAAAAPFSGVPYQWGGGHASMPGPSFAAGHGRVGVGLDCSGFARAVLANMGINVSGTADGLLGSAKSHPAVFALQPGDLVFYEGIHPNHVMVYIGNGQVIGETHTGASGPEVKSVGYLAITGTGRYVASEKTGSSGSSTAAPQTTPHNPKDFAGKAKTTMKGLLATLQLAKGTTGTADDRVALGQILSFLKTQLRTATDPAQKASILGQINEFAAELAGLKTKKKGASKYAAGSSVESLSLDLSKELKALGGLTAAGLDDVVGKVRPKIEHLQDLLSKPITKKQLAAARVQLKALLQSYDVKGLEGVAGDLATGKKTASSLVGALLRMPRDIKIPIKDAWGEVVKTISPGELLIQAEKAMDALAGVKTSRQAKAALAELKKVGDLATAAVSIDKDGVAKAAQDAVDAANQVVSSATSVFEAGWGRMAQKALSAFDAETQDALQKLQVLVTGANGGFLYGEGGQTPAQLALAGLTPTEALRQQLSGAHDAAAAAKTLTGLRAGVGTAQSDVASKQATVDKYVGAGFSEQANVVRQARQDLADAQKTLTDAQQALDDELYSQQQSSLQTQGDAERAALQQKADAEQSAATSQLEQARKNYQSQRDLQREHLQDMLDDLEQGLEKGTTSLADARTKLAGIWDAIGVDSGIAGQVMGDSFVQSLNESLNDAQHGIWPTLDTLKQALADLQHLKDIQSNPAAGSRAGAVGNPGRLGILGALAGRIPALAEGGVIDRPTYALLGESARARREIVTPETLMRQIVREELGRAGGGALVNVEHMEVRDTADAQLIAGRLSHLARTRPRA